MGKSLYIKKTLTVIIINYSIEKFIDLGSEILEQINQAPSPCHPEFISGAMIPNKAWNL